MTINRAPALAKQTAPLALVPEANRPFELALTKSLGEALETSAALTDNPSPADLRKLRRSLRKIDMLIQTKGLAVDAQTLEGLHQENKTLARRVGKLRAWDVARNLWQDWFQKPTHPLFVKIDRILITKRAAELQLFQTDGINRDHLITMRQLAETISAQPGLTADTKPDASPHLQKILKQQKRFTKTSELEDLHSLRRESRRARYLLEAGEFSTEKQLVLHKTLRTIQKRIGQIGDFCEFSLILKELKHDPAIKKDRATRTQLDKIRQELKTQIGELVLAWHDTWPKRKKRIKATLS